MWYASGSDVCRTFLYLQSKIYRICTIWWIWCWVRQKRKVKVNRGQTLAGRLHWGRSCTCLLVLVWRFLECLPEGKSANSSRAGCRWKWSLCDALGSFHRSLTVQLPYQTGMQLVRTADGVHPDGRGQVVFRQCPQEKKGEPWGVDGPGRVPRDVDPREFEAAHLLMWMGWCVPRLSLLTSMMSSFVSLVLRSSLLLAHHKNIHV